MLFEEERIEPIRPKRPEMPPETRMDYEIGFLFNFISGKSTRFDLEPVLIFKRNGILEYKRVSLQVSKGLAYLQPLDDDFYDALLEFSDNQLLKWMTWTGNRFIRNHSGTWSHSSTKELFNLRKHYIEILGRIWPRLLKWPKLFIQQTGRVSTFALMPVELSEESPELSLSVEYHDKNIQVRLVTQVGGKEVDLKLLGGFLFEKQGTLYLLNSKESLNLINTYKHGTLSFPVEEKKEVVQNHVIPWRDKYRVELSEKLNIEISNPEVQPRIMLTELNESNLMIKPQFIYSDEVVDYDTEMNLVVEKDGHVKIIQRNKEEEKKVYEYLRTLHRNFSNQRNNLYYYLPFDEVMRKSWFITFIRNLQDANYVMHGLSELQKFRYNTTEPKFNIQASTSVDWFDLKVTIHWGDQEVTLKEIRRAILNGQDTIMLADGTLGHIPDEWIRQYSLLLRTGAEENGTLRINKLHYTLVEDILDSIEENASVREDIEAKKKKLVQYDEIKREPLSSAIVASLRPYQESGFNWLQALDDLGWGGCLADDMGLGKTLQTISFLQFLKEKYPGSTQLVICPTSLIFNWESELQKFCPTMKYYTYYGLQREFNKTHFEEYDVVLTSYGVMRNDLEDLNNFLWQYIILDESQAIKNPDARVTRAVQQLRAVNRVILSGTPVQNNTMDLFAQFNFLNPGLLGNREFFNREFAQPIDKDDDKEKTRYLQRLIYPFTLRRTKEQVAKDLPDKTVTVLWCNMDPEQRKLYNEYRDNYRNLLLKKIDEEGVGKSGIYVLEGLLKLRQICDHPRLLKNSEYEDNRSVKMDELIREVKENAGHHKLLIFSQFTEMLKLIKEEFVTADITHCYLDGSTPLKKRKEEVNRFQEDESVTTFLISLKAGGVGLNLTVADYVYLVDPWWNPAAEQQAIDRAHRIGQKRKVFAYKMICKDTVEEKIIQLQERKKMLADELIHEDSGTVKNLSREDVEFLFG